MERGRSWVVCSVTHWIYGYYTYKNAPGTHPARDAVEWARVGHRHSLQPSVARGGRAGPAGGGDLLTPAGAAFLVHRSLGGGGRPPKPQEWGS